jgi:hypothetical protein
MPFANPGGIRDGGLFVEKGCNVAAWLAAIEQESTLKEIGPPAFVAICHSLRQRRLFKKSGLPSHVRRRRGKSPDWALFAPALIR